MGQFGDKFRKAREAKKLSYDDVSRVTKIGARMLQAIEDEHFDQLPGGVFNKGFIRAYAKHLGLNDEEAVSDYLAALRQAQIDANEYRDPHIPVTRPPAVPEKRPQPAPAAPAAKPPAPKPQPAKAPVEVADEELPELQLPRAEHVRPRREFPADRESVISARLIAVAVVVVILAVVFFWMRHTRVTRTEAASSTPRPAPAAAASQSPAPATVAPTTTAPAQPTARPASASVTNAPAPKPQPVTGQAQPPDATKTTPAALAEKTPAEKNPEENDATVRVPAKPAPAAKSAPPMTLVIRATENTWISVLADGQLVSQETLIAPANATIHATREITVKVGNAAGVTFLWNNQELPAQGAESEVKTLVFDATGMRVTNQ